MVKKINQSQFSEVEKSSCAIVDFSAEWSGPCKMLEPMLDEVAEEITDVDFYNVDVDENPALARNFWIMNIPAVVALKNGEVVGTSFGLVPKESMIDFIKGAFK